MKISVIIPCFNAASTLRQQLDALAQQTVAPWEVIIADNGSTDLSKHTAKQYESRFPKLQIIDASTQRGASHARNMGAQAATGDYLAFCDADDVVDCEWVSALQRAFTKHNFVASRFDFTKLNDTVINNPQSKGLQNFRVPFMPFAGGCGLGIRRSLHEAVSGFDENLLYLEDADYCIRVQLLGESLTFLPDAVVHIRNSSYQKRSFLLTRKASFCHGYNWGTGLAKLYKRYQKYGMYLHGITPRLAVSTLYIGRSFLTGFSCDSIWKVGWQLGILHGFIQNRTFQL